MLKRDRRLSAIGEAKPANHHAHQKRSHLRVCLSLRQVQAPLCFLLEVQRIAHRTRPLSPSGIAPGRQVDTSCGQKYVDKLAISCVQRRFCIDFFAEHAAAGRPRLSRSLTIGRF